MSNELRYLLHGNKEKYEDVTTPLYVTSQESTVWQKVGQQVLHRKNEDWRLLDPMLVEHIISSKHQALGIKLLQSEEVINLIRELKADCVDGSLLELCERYELLRYISQRPANENLWKELHLHEATNGELVCIEVGRTYLESPDFPLDEQLQEYIVLIRRNTQEINQDWIPLWSPNLAIATILNRPNPHEYYKLIVDALERMSLQEREQCRVNLKNANWLPIRAAGRGVSPLDILKLPKNLVKHEHVIVSLDSTKYPESELPSSVHTSMAYMWIARLFTSWDEETVIRKVLAHSDKPPRYWSNFCAVILDAVQDLDIPKDLEVELGTQEWLLLGDRQIALEQVIEIVPRALKQYLSALVALSADEYTESSKLPDAVKNHQSLSKLFSRWDEEHVIDFILRQREPYKHLDITLKALSILVSNPHKKNIENNDQLRRVAWLADAQGNPVYPQNVIEYPSLQDEIEGLLLTVPCSYVGSSQLAKQIRAEESCWRWLTTKLFITQDKALVKVGELLKQAPKYQLGIFQIDEFPLDGALEVFDKIDVSFLPAWNFAKQIYNKENFKQYLLPNLLGQIDENKIVTILQRLALKDSQPEETTIDVFNRYLSLAVQYNRFPQEILGQIHLLNRRREWKTPDKLTWGNRDNIDGAYVLDSKQAEIMRLYLNSLDTNSILETSAITAVGSGKYVVIAL